MTTVELYIAGFPEDVQRILRKFRATIRRALPQATERISYGVPTYRLDRDVIHFGAFKKHIGFYPPVRSGARVTDREVPRREGKPAIPAR